jgi:hypothetical protein
MVVRASRLKRIRRLKRVALALAVAGIAAPSAQANYPDAGLRAGNESEGLVVRGEYKGGIGEVATAPMSPQELQALRVRGQELNRLYGPAESVVTPEALRALELRGEAMNRFYRADSPGAPVRGEIKTDVRDVAPLPVSTSAPDSVGFDWRDAGIGAAGGFALVLLGASGLVALRRGRKSGLATA